MISLDLMKSSEVRISGDWSNSNYYVLQWSVPSLNFTGTGNGSSIESSKKAKVVSRRESCTLVQMWCKFLGVLDRVQRTFWWMTDPHHNHLLD